jgi:FkbM family methyltransferase
VNATPQSQTVFDHDHYRRLIEARGETIRKSIASLKRPFGIASALDVGCGLGFFAQILHESGLDVRAFDGREENVQEGRRRFPEVAFEIGDVQDINIRRLGEFDLVLCFGLLYHLENPFAAIRNLRALTRKALLLESMCLPDENPWMLLREEPRLEDQSLTDVAFYASEGCLAKMLYRAGFSFVYRMDTLPDHDDFKDSPAHLRRRTVLLATATEVATRGFTFFPEPKERKDPWQREMGKIGALRLRASSFSKKPARQKYLALAHRARRLIPGLPIPIRLPFGAWWSVENSVLDYELTTKGFESAEIEFVKRFLKRGMTVLDVGAHHGLYTLLASNLVGPTGKVIAFEPSPRERKRLLKHLRWNGLREVQVEPYALGAKSGEAKLYLTDSFNDWCNSLRPPADGSEQVITVPVRTLDEAISLFKLDKIDLLKLDIEGGELDALAGAEKTLTLPERPVILIEVQDHRTAPWGHKGVDVIRFLERMRYEWATVSPEGFLQRMNTGVDEYDGNFVAIPSEKSEQILKELQPRDTA